MGISSVDEDKAAAALMTLPSVDDCIVVRRVDTDGVSGLVAYVVPTGTFVAERLRKDLKTLLPEHLIPAAYVGVSSLPLTDDGLPDTHLLSTLEVVDPQLTAAWEQKLRSLPEIDRAVVRIEDRVKPQRVLHRTDMLPGRSVRHNRATSGSGRRPTAEPPHSVRHGGRPSIAHGTPLERNVPRNLSIVLRGAALNEPSHGITYVRHDGTELHQSYGGLLDEAAAILGGLHARGLTPGDHVLLQIPENRDLIPAFWGCV